MLLCLSQNFHWKTGILCLPVKHQMKIKVKKRGIIRTKLRELNSILSLSCSRWHEYMELWLLSGCYCLILSVFSIRTSWILDSTDSLGSISSVYMKARRAHSYFYFQDNTNTVLLFRMLLPERDWLETFWIRNLLSFR